MAPAQTQEPARGRHGPTVDRDELVGLVTDLVDEDKPHTHQGVTPDELAEHVRWAPKTIYKHLKELAEAGRIDCGWLRVGTHPKQVYRPARTDDERGERRC